MYTREGLLYLDDQTTAQPTQVDRRGSGLGVLFDGVAVAVVRVAAVVCGSWLVVLDLT